jgi:hypothetical protein
MSMSDRDGKIWMDGELVEWRDAKIHVLSHTLHYGCGAFEGVRAYHTAAAPISQTYARLEPPIAGMSSRTVRAIRGSLLRIICSDCSGYS